MPRGRPPAPIEHHRRVGRAGGTKKADGRNLPILAEVVQLPQADGAPDIPVGLGDAGMRLWRRIWQDGITWISPQSDLEAAEQACQAADDVATARERYRATREPADARAVVALAKRLDEWLSALGFTPTARSRLGVAEVKRVSALDKLLERRQG